MLSAAPPNSSSLVFFFSLSFFLFCLDLEKFNISFSAFDLDRFYIATDIAELLEDGQHHEVDESALAASNFGGVAVAQKGDLHAVLLLVVALSKEFRKEPVSPNFRNLETSD